MPNRTRTALHSVVLGLLIAAALPAIAAPPAPAGPYGLPTSSGDARMGPLMDALLAGFQRVHPEWQRGRPWQHTSDANAFPALMFETADMAPLARAPLPAEIAPYAHQFHGDMMKTPLLVRIGGTPEQPAWVAVNKRPGSPLPRRVSLFLDYALSADGQALVATGGQFAPLDAAAVAAERAKLDGYLVPLDPALPAYRAQGAVRGYISSVGSDGMKTLMDRWMREFRALQPGVRKGERWEHLGTLNGFHALVAGAADIAPMGRELWPAELAAYASARAAAAPLEIRVARGGFNTPQRTTAQAIFVHPSNPLSTISVPQLRALLASGAGLATWGQLGLQGEWRDRPIHIYMPPPAAPNAMSMQSMVLQGQAWNPGARSGTIEQTASAIAGDPAAIGFGGLEEGGPGLKALAVAAADGAAPVALTYESASTGAYPLTRYMYIRLNARPGTPLPPAVREFLRYVLSRAGQEPIRYSGYYPLTAAEVRQELARIR